MIELDFIPELFWAEMRNDGLVIDSFLMPTKTILFGSLVLPDITCRIMSHSYMTSCEGDLRILRHDETRVTVEFTPRTTEILRIEEDLRELGDTI